MERPPAPTGGHEQLNPPRKPPSQIFFDANTWFPFKGNKMNNSESSETEDEKPIKGKALRKWIKSIDKDEAIAYFMDAQKWFRTPRPLQVAILMKAGLEYLPTALELYIRASIADWAKIDLICRDSEEEISELFGVSAGGVRSAASEIKSRGIVRLGKNGQRRRPWAIVEMEKQIDADPTTSQTPTPLPAKRQPHHQPNVYPTTSQTPHKKGIEKKEIEKNEIEDRKDRKAHACLPIAIHSFSQSEIQTLLDSFPWGNHKLDSPEGLASCWTILIDIFNQPSEAKAERDNGSAENFDPMDSRRAYKILEQMEEYGDPDTIRNWMEWYIAGGGLSRSQWLTAFSYSWETYQPIAAEAQKAKMAEEESRRAEERRVMLEQERRDEEERERIWAEQEPQRLEKQKADEEAKKLKAIEDEAMLQRKREEFHKSLPTPESIRRSVDSVAVPHGGLGKLDGYLDFVTLLVTAVPILGLVQDFDSKRYDYMPIARESFGGDLGGLERKTRDFVAAVADDYIGRLKTEGHSKLPKLQATWKMYAQFFKIDPDAVWSPPKTCMAVESEGDFESPFGNDD